jgi:translation initiation factor 2-alpha kinase 3
LQLSHEGKYIKLIPSLTGGLYKYDGESLQAMPLNADSLLKKSFKLSQDVVITGK